ncbi:MAG TPA: DUF3500 domain-containing protein [Polyangia bacterium]|nr:DUF3500 domain-containing protein [Polyangia bacterium]
MGLLSACSTARPLAPRAQTAQPTVPATAPASDATTQTVAAANAFVATLDDAAKAKLIYPFDGDQKTKWSNFPVGMYPRNGVRWGDLTAAQRAAATRLLTTALSKSGFDKVRAIMQGDEVLKVAEKEHPSGPPPFGGPDGPPNGKQHGPPGGDRQGPPPGLHMGNFRGPSFGRDEYFLAFCGAPSSTQPWMLQFGGHHLAINLTMVGKRAVMTPSLPAAQPATYELEGQTVRPLGRENDEAFALINALDSAQQKQAILNYRVSDLVLGPGEDGKTIQPEGIRASALTPAQQRMLLDLAHEWVGIVNDQAATARMAEIASTLADTYFAWSGPTTNGASAYFRIQGPTLVIEYSPQRMHGPGGLDHEHIHTIYRDPTNDYGARLVQ